MLNISDLLELSVNPQLFKIGIALIYITGFILLISVILKFIEHAKNHQQLAKQRSHCFSTREMTLCMLIFFPFWINSWGQFKNITETTQYIFFAFGSVMVIFATIWHIWAKINIGLLWSDGIEIKKKHPLVTQGAYALARHPMYASLLMWCWGASFLMFNWLTLLLITGVFLPLMVIRAKDEEKELVLKNLDYIFYRRNVRMLTPTIFGIYSILIRIIFIILLGYFIVTESISVPTLTFLVLTHLYLGYSLSPEKVAFSYRSKSGMMLIFGLLGLYVSAIFFYFFYLFLAMFLYGLKWNCPCMLVYEKFHGCPCFILLKKACKR